MLAAEHRAMTDGQLLHRFVAHHEEAAFHDLVARHGPKVLHLCRKILHDGHDAEDAFQATFLVLLRKVTSIQSPELLGYWLCGVASSRCYPNLFRRVGPGRNFGSRSMRN
jgi:DNA-directed RNA polymerase specialized sigma24 family protein